MLAGRRAQQLVLDRLAGAEREAPVAGEEALDVVPVLDVERLVEPHRVLLLLDRLRRRERPDDQARRVARQHAHEQEGEQRRAEDGRGARRRSCPTTRSSRHGRTGRAGRGWSRARSAITLAAVTASSTPMPGKTPIHHWPVRKYCRPLGDHRAPLGRRRLRAEPDEAERRQGQDREAEERPPPGSAASS